LPGICLAPGTPAGFFDAVVLGADPSGVNDSGQALQDSIDAAHTQGRGLWLPPGEYLAASKLFVDRVTVRGAGPWRTVLTGAGVGVFGNAAPNANARCIWPASPSSAPPRSATTPPSAAR